LCCLRALRIVTWQTMVGEPLGRLTVTIDISQNELRRRKVFLGGRSVRAVSSFVRMEFPDEAYEDIGRGVRAIARGYRQAFEAGKNGGSSKAGRKKTQKLA
jgi:hypothetical protein